MLSRIIKFAGVGLGLMLVAVSLPLYAHTPSGTETEVEAEVISQADGDREASLTCKRAQTKLSDYLSNLDEIRTEQLSENRSIVAFVNNIALRLEHNEQADTSLGDDVAHLNELLTDQEMAYSQLQSALRTAISVSCSSSKDVDDLRAKVSDIRSNAGEVNQLQTDFEDYITDTVVKNLAEAQAEIESNTEESKANS